MGIKSESNTVHIDGEGISFSKLEDYVRSIASEYPGKAIKHYEIIITFENDDNKTLPEIVNRFVEGEDLYFTYHGKAAFIKKIVGIYQKISGKHIDFDSIWHERNFNRFAVSIGCHYMITPLHFSPYSTDAKSNAYSVAPYLYHNGDSKEDLLKRLNDYFASYHRKTNGIIFNKLFYSETCPILGNLLEHIDPENAEKYRFLSARCDVAEFNNQDSEIGEKFTDINQWLSEIGCEFRFYDCSLEEQLVSADKLMYLSDRDPERPDY